MNIAKKKPQRTVEVVWVEGYKGLKNPTPITAHKLLAMSEHEWGYLRARITDRRHDKDGLMARCGMCQKEVYISVARLDGVNLPLFSHYSGSDPSCPWYQGGNAHPNAIRASQYQGNQESDFHRKMCELVAELAALDSRYVDHTVSKYLPPTKNEHGRFPDVCVEWKGFGKFAVEFPMSHTFQTEISARCKHYEYEGIPLIWILFGIDATRPIPQNFRDVIHRHRGNAFVLDSDAISESRKQKTLVLTCYLQNNGGFDSPKCVRLDKLTIPTSKLPYYEDRVTERLRSNIHERRRPWFNAVKSWDRVSPLRGLDLHQGLLIAAAFSICATANGKKRNYASRDPNIRAMLNNRLNHRQISSYATLLTQLIKNTSISSKLLEGTVGDHLRRSCAEYQADEQSDEWKLLRELFPEALDPLIRSQLQELGSLPPWAQPEEDP